MAYEKATESVWLFGMYQCLYSAVRLLVCWVRTDLEKPQHFTQWLAESLRMAEK